MLDHQAAEGLAVYEDDPGRYLVRVGDGLGREATGGDKNAPVNLSAVQTARDDLTLLTTENGETNDVMVAINERMGFRPVEITAQLVKRL